MSIRLSVARGLVRHDRLAEWTLLLRSEIVRGMRGGKAQPLGLVAWGRRYLPAHFRQPPSRMHHWLDAELDAMCHERGVKLNAIGPRGGAKSTLVTLAYVLRAALEGWEPYLWIVSDTRHQAARHLENIKLELLENEHLAGDYPAAIGKGSHWRGTAVRLNNGVLIEAFGAGQRMRGRRHGANRPTLIVCDDLQNDQHISSALQRDSSRDWFHGTLAKAGTKRTNIVNLATALHRDALALELHRTPGWNSRVFPAIEHWPERMELWAEWERLYCQLDNPRRQEDARAFYDQRREAMDAGSELLWPEEEDLYHLMSMRVEGGRTAFEREKQGSPANPDLCEWPEDYFDAAIWFDEWPRNCRVKIVALDPSKGRDARHGDYSAFVKLAVDAAGTLYAEADLARRPSPQIVADGVEICRRFQPDAFGIETNQFQELLGGQFEEEFRRQGFLAARPWMLDNRVNKQVRIRRLGPYLASHRLRFKADSPSTRLLVEQLREFPTGDYDDGPDALEMAIRLAGELLGAAPAEDGLGDRLPLEIPR